VISDRLFDHAAESLVAFRRVEYWWFHLVHGCLIVRQPRLSVKLPRCCASSGIGSEQPIPADSLSRTLFRSHWRLGGERRLCGSRRHGATERLLQLIAGCLTDGSLKRKGTLWQVVTDCHGPRFRCWHAHSSGFRASALQTMRECNPSRLTVRESPAHDSAALDQMSSAPFTLDPLPCFPAVLFGEACFTTYSPCSCRYSSSASSRIDFAGARFRGTCFLNLSAIGFRNPLFATMPFPQADLRAKSSTLLRLLGGTL